MTLTNQAATPERHPSGSNASIDGAARDGKHIVLTTYGSLGNLHPYKAAEAGRIVRSEDGARAAAEAIETMLKKVSAV